MIILNPIKTHYPLNFSFFIHIRDNNTGIHRAVTETLNRGGGTLLSRQATTLPLTENLLSVRYFPRH